MKIKDYLHLYLGCDTNNGKLVGINETTCFILLENGETKYEDLNNNNQLIKPILRKFSDMSINESTELNKRGISIGQRKGYSFTPDAILYLLTLRIDLFNLIAEGLAIDLNQSK
ncbi:MAG: hypothetical protein ABI863_20610 [Ginsengibacter sp.]